MVLSGDYDDDGDGHNVDGDDGDGDFAELASGCCGGGGRGKHSGGSRSHPA